MQSWVELWRNEKGKYMSLLKEIIIDWFSKLPNGHAEHPYTEEELDVLKEILLEYKIEPSEVMNYFSRRNFIAEEAHIEQDSIDIDDLENSGNEFRTLLDSYEIFEKVLLDRYISAEVTTYGLKSLYAKLVGLPKEQSTHIRRIIAKNTNRELSGGTFKMGQYEAILLNLLKETVTIKGSTPEILWICIVMGGKMIIDSNDVDIKANMQIDGINCKLFDGIERDKVLILGSIPDASISLLQTMINFNEAISDYKPETLDRDSVNEVLKSLSSPENRDEIAGLLQSATTSKLPALQKLVSKIKSSLGDKDINSITQTFCDDLDKFIMSKLVEIPYYINIVGDMIYMLSSDKLYPSLNCTKENRLSGNVLSLKDYNLYISSSAIAEKMME